MNARLEFTRKTLVSALLAALILLAVSACGGGGDNGGGGTIPPPDPGSDPTRPTIFRLVPNFGAPGTIVVIEGINFGKEMGTSNVTYNGVKLTVQSDAAGKKLWSDTKITVKIPDDAVTGLMTVNKLGKQSYAGKNAKFTVGTIEPPSGELSITAISPLSGKPGTLLQITGDGFGASRGSSIVRIGTFACDVNSRLNTGTGEFQEQWSNSNIEVIVPAKDIFGVLPQVLPVTVEVAGTISNDNYKFTVEDVEDTNQPAIITSVTPMQGEVGQTIEIRGQNFGNQIGSSYVTFNGIRAQVVSWSSAVVLINVPSGADTGPLRIHIRDVAYPIPNLPPAEVVGLPYPINFEVVVAARITGVSPVNVVFGGKVTLYGSHLGSEPGTLTVDMAGTSGSARVFSADEFNGSDPNFTWTQSAVTFVMPSNIAVSINPTTGNFNAGKVRLVTFDSRVADEQTLTIKNAFDGYVTSNYTAVPVGEPVTLTAFVPGASNQYKYDWEYGDGMFVSGLNNQVSKSYSTANKTYTPRVRVTHIASGSASLFIGPEILIGQAGLPLIGRMRVVDVKSPEPNLGIQIGSVPRSPIANLNKPVAHAGDWIKIEGFYFGETVNASGIEITRKDVSGQQYFGSVVLDPGSGLQAWSDREITFRVTASNFGMTGDVRVRTIDDLLSSNSAFLIVEPRIDSINPATPTTSESVTFITYDNGLNVRGFDGPDDVAERMTRLIIFMPGGQGFVVNPTNINSNQVIFDFGGWTPLDGTGNPVPKTAGSYTFYLWSGVLLEGRTEEIVNSGIIGPGGTFTFS